MPVMSIPWTVVDPSDVSPPQPECWFQSDPPHCGRPLSALPAKRHLTPNCRVQVSLLQETQCAHNDLVQSTEHIHGSMAVPKSARNGAQVQSNGVATGRIKPKPTKLAKKRRTTALSTALPPTLSTQNEVGETTTSTRKIADDKGDSVATIPPDAPKIVIENGNLNGGKQISGEVVNGDQSETGVASDGAFKISTDIPKGENLLDLESFDQLSFSKRGSILLGGKRGVRRPRPTKQPTSPKLPISAPQPMLSPPSPEPPSQPSARVISLEDEAASNRVRSMYEYGDPDGPAMAINRLSLVPDAPTPPASSHSVAISIESGSGTPEDAMRHLQGPNGATDTNVRSNGALSPDIRSPSAFSNYKSNRRESMIIREADELAGGIEDWAALDSSDVDRYGFISPQRKVSAPTSSSPRACLTPEPSQSPHQVSSVLSSPNGANTRKTSATSSPRRNVLSPHRLSRIPSRKASSRSLQAPPSVLSNASSQANRHRGVNGAMFPIPGSKNKRTLAEAGDMLTLPPGLAQEEAASQESTARAAAQRAKEISRGDKWRKMAKPITRHQYLDMPRSSHGGVQSRASNSRNSTSPGRGRESRAGTAAAGGGGGGGTEFDFDPASPKVISRTWKGIPDRWRASAWWAFLRRSAERRQRHYAAVDSRNPTRAQSQSSDVDLDHDLDASSLIELFFTLVSTPCADDVQIDLDVPRTIAGHVMFRRRYRGGQRLLFRVLHCLSLAFPEVRYVQGMAGVAATLLCYFEEERAFVMACWLWKCRGVEGLYADGFKGLMEALERLEGWVGDGAVGTRLTTLNIPPTTYGTRWYLTLFNYSVPFPAQLRIWDIMMLHDCTIYPAIQPVKSRGTPQQPAQIPSAIHTHDVLHATSAALLDGLADVLVDADFETAMRALTSFVPVCDEDLLMRVVNVEWGRRGKVRERELQRERLKAKEKEREKVKKKKKA